jgi:hypothetical protein
MSAKLHSVIPEVKTPLVTIITTSHPACFIFFVWEGVIFNQTENHPSLNVLIHLGSYVSFKRLVIVKQNKIKGYL